MTLSRFKEETSQKEARGCVSNQVERPSAGTTVSQGQSVKTPYVTDAASSAWPINEILVAWGGGGNGACAWMSVTAWQRARPVRQAWRGRAQGDPPSSDTDRARGGHSPSLLGRTEAEGVAVTTAALKRDRESARDSAWARPSEKRPPRRARHLLGRCGRGLQGRGRPSRAPRAFRMSAQAQMRAMLDQLMGTSRDGKKSCLLSCLEETREVPVWGSGARKA